MSQPPKSTLTDEQAEKRQPSAREREWELKTLNPTLAKSPERMAEFTTVSGFPIRRLYTPADLADWDVERDLGLPGEPPYTRPPFTVTYKHTPAGWGKRTGRRLSVGSQPQPSRW